MTSTGNLRGRNSPKLSIQMVSGPPTVLVGLEGELGLAEVELLRSQLRPVLAQQPEVLLLDLHGLTNLSSLGLAALLDLRRTVQRWGGDVQLTGLNSHLCHIFRVTRLDVVFTIIDELVAA